LTAFPDILRGHLVTLRRFVPTDIGAGYLGWLQDPEVTRYSNQRFRNHDWASAEAYLAGFAQTPNLFLLIRDGNDEAIGTMTAYFAPQHGTADLGIMVGERSAWGHGFGSDAWVTLLNWLLGPGGQRKVTAGTLASNAQMLRLAEKSGMRIEGRRERQEILDGAEVDIVLFARFAPILAAP
jgi:[ribosomal protein S5]-alanine N-acetyltransferase